MVLDLFEFWWARRPPSLNYAADDHSNDEASPAAAFQTRLGIRWTGLILILVGETPTLLELRHCDFNLFVDVVAEILDDVVLSIRGVLAHVER